MIKYILKITFFFLFCTRAILHLFLYSHRELKAGEPSSLQRNTVCYPAFMLSFAEKYILILGNSYILSSVVPSILVAYSYLSFLLPFYERVVFAQRSLTSKNVALNLHQNLLNVKFEATCGSECL